jgi:hypothetical protein
MRFEALEIIKDNYPAGVTKKFIIKSLGTTHEYIEETINRLLEDGLVRSIMRTNPDHKINKRQDTLWLPTVKCGQQFNATYGRKDPRDILYEFQKVALERLMAANGLTSWPPSSLPDAP